MHRAADPPLESLGVTFVGLARLRWLWLSCQLMVVLAVWAWGGWPMRVGVALGLVSAGLLSNIALEWVVRVNRAKREWGLAAVFLLDVGLLTALLAATGGAYNPFSSLYILYVAFGALILGGGWTWALVAAAAVGYSALYLLDIHPPGGHHADHMQLHLAGMWAAFVVVGPVVAFGIGRLRVALRENRVRLDSARQVAQRREKLASLGTLAAGAAHELATPLATVAVVARELERHADGAVAGDAALIRQEIARCDRILRQLADDVGAGRGEAPAATTVGELVDLSLERLTRQTDIEVVLPEALEEHPLTLPVRQVSRALESVLANALDASSLSGQVILTVSLDGDLFLEVRDSGVGMDAATLARVGEPFFTTKEVGDGTGLGVFHARSVLESLGGELTLDSALGKGTRATLRIPGV